MQVGLPNAEKNKNKKPTGRPLEFEFQPNNE